MRSPFVVEFAWVLIAVFLTQTPEAYKQSKVAEFVSPAERQGILIRNLRSYEIDHPIITDHQNSHLGYLTDASSRRRRKRAINLVGEHEPFHYKFSSAGEDYYMKLRMNTDLFGPNFKVENLYDEDKIETEKMSEHCYLIGETVPHNHSVAISDCDGLYGVVNTEEDAVYIEPLLNDSYIDEKKLKGNGRPHLVYRQSQLPKLDKQINPLDIRNIAPARSRATPKRNVHYSYVKFINRSGRIVKLLWLNKQNRKAFFATLMPDTSRIVNTFTLHRWIAEDEVTGKPFLVGNSLEYVPKKNKVSSRANVYIRIPRSLKLPPASMKEIRNKIGTKYIESMAVADKSVVTFHGKDRVARYILALMNVVSHVFKHKSVGVQINYVLVRIVLLHKDPKEVTLGSDENKSLLTACGYMHKIRKGRSDADPYFHDHATFLTRRHFGRAAGYAPVYGMCHGTRSCSINGEDGFPSAFIIAHEVGHSLGMEHDGEGGNKCGSDTSRGSIMSPLVQARINRYHWSACSRKELMSSIRNFHCLNDSPNKNYTADLPFIHTHSGVHYSTDDQCRFDFGTGYKFCRAFHRDPCKELWCNMPEPYHNLCKSMRAPALNGTKCGEKKWCMSGHCVPSDVSFTEPPPVDGKWGEWGKWKECSKKCGVGLRIRERFCNNPMPLYGGKNCVGPSKEENTCNTKNCQKTVSLHEDERKQQCPLIGKRRGSSRTWSFYDERKVNLNCTFEHDMCSWTNLRLTDQQDLKLNKGRTKTGKTGPSVDHTTTTSKGQYIYFEASNPAKYRHKARISSPDMGVRRGCLSFWYHMYGKRQVGALSVLKLDVNGTAKLWTKKGNQGDQWSQGRVEIRADSLYNLVFEVQRDRSYLSDIALDDIMFTPEPCEKNDDEDRGPSNPCVVSCVTSGTRGKIIMDSPVINGLRCYDNSSLDICFQGKCRNVGCDGLMDSEKEFDNCGVCGGDGSSCDLKVGTIKKTPEKDFELLLNIPKGSSNINVKKSRESEHMLVLTVKDPKRSGGEYPVVKGNDRESPPAIYNAVGTHFVYTNNNGEQTIKSFGVTNGDVSIKVRHGRRKRAVELKYEYFDVKTDSKKQSSLKTTPSTTTVVTNEDVETRWIVTDIWMPCSRSCGKGVSFLKYFCQSGEKVVPRRRCKDLKLNVEQKFKYCNTQPCEGGGDVDRYNWKTGPWSACSKNCSVGNMTRQVTCRKLPQNNIVLKTYCKDVKPTETKACFVKECPLKWMTGNWSECTTTCGVGGQSRDVYCTNAEGQRTSGCNVDKRPDVSRSCRNPVCPHDTADPLDCDFEKDLCRWQQMKGDHFDWIRNQGRTKSSETGPNRDNTHKNLKGHYLYVEASIKHRKDDAARLVSPDVNAKNACLKFYRNMNGASTGELRVKVLTTAGPKIMWSKKGHHGRRWIKTEVDISEQRPYKIVIEGLLGKGWRGDMAIDDIEFRRGKCAENAKPENKNQAGSRNRN